LSALSSTLRLTRSPGRATPRADRTAKRLRSWTRRALAGRQGTIVDHKIGRKGYYPDMRDHGWEVDAWPDLLRPGARGRHPVIGGRSGSATTAVRPKKLIERLYAHSGGLNDKGQWLNTALSAVCLITGQTRTGSRIARRTCSQPATRGVYSIAPRPTPAGSVKPGHGPSTGDVPDRRFASGIDQRLHQPQTRPHDVEPDDLARLLRSAGGFPA